MIPEGIPQRASHTDAYSHGYVVSNERLPAACSGWQPRPLGSLTLYVQSATASAIFTSDQSGHTVALVGHPVDLILESIDAEEIVGKCAQLLDKEGLEAAIRYIAYLGGRFVAFFVVDGYLTVVPDCHATQSAFWSARKGAICVASHSSLVAETLSLPIDEVARGLLVDLKRMKPTGARYYPGVRTGFADVRPVVANCLLSIQIETALATHMRFYPFSAIPERTTDEAFAIFERYFLTHVRLLSSFGQVGISLTSGNDSLATLGAVLNSPPSDLFAFTYFLTSKASTPNTADMLGANDLAFKAGIRHKILKWTPGKQQSDSEFDILFDQAWPDGGQARPVARCLYEELPRRFFELQSTAAETGTAYYSGRKVQEISPERLTSLWQGKAVGELGRFSREFAEYIDYVQFTDVNLMNIDYHDAFYWEHRNTCWAANRYHEGDMGHRVLLPFNQRDLIEAMLSVPLDERKSKLLVKMFAAKYAPDVTPNGRQTDAGIAQENFR